MPTVFRKDSLIRVVLCYEESYRFYGNVPQRLRDALKNCKYDIFRIKFTHNGSYFIADKKGNYSYWM